MFVRLLLSFCSFFDLPFYCTQRCARSGPPKPLPPPRPMPSSDPSAVDVQKTTLQNTSSGGVPLTGSVRPPRPQSAIPAAAAHQRGAHNKDGGGPARARKPVRKVLPASTSSSESEESLIAAEEKGDKDAVWQLKQRMETAEEEAAAAAAAVIAEGDGSEFFANPNGPPLPPPPHRVRSAAQHA